MNKPSPGTKLSESNVSPSPQHFNASQTASFPSPSLVLSERLETKGYDRLAEESSAFHSFMEHMMTFGFPVILISVLYLSTAKLYESNLIWSVLIAVPLGFALGDFLTGLFHWAADTYGTEKTPFLGKNFIKPFRLHHLYPRDICTHGIVEAIGNSCIVCNPLLLLCLYFLWGQDVTATTGFAALTFGVTLGVGIATNIFHKWAHLESAPRLIQILQRSRLILPPEHHDGHHTPPFMRNYCIANGWCNPLLNRINFFLRLETIIARLGIRPSR